MIGTAVQAAQRAKRRHILESRGICRLSQRVRAQQQMAKAPLGNLLLGAAQMRTASEDFWLPE